MVLKIDNRGVIEIGVRDGVPGFRFAGSDGGGISHEVRAHFAADFALGLQLGTVTKVR